MISNFRQKRQLQDIALRIVQEAGCSSGRVYLADIFTKLGILNSIFRVLAEGIGAIERDTTRWWRLRANGLALLKEAETFRCAIAEICQNLWHYWAGERDDQKKQITSGANHSRNTIKKSLKWFESLGLFVLETEIEAPIYGKYKGEDQFRSPNKLFKSFNLELALQAYEALEQVLHQQLAIPRRLRLPYYMPDHAGMLSRLLYVAVFGREYRSFSKLPEGLEDLEQHSSIYLAQGQISSLEQQIEEQARLGMSRIVFDLERMKRDVIAKLQSLERQNGFMLPY